MQKNRSRGRQRVTKGCAIKSCKLAACLTCQTSWQQNSKYAMGCKVFAVRGFMAALPDAATLAVTATRPGSLHMVLIYITLSLPSIHSNDMNSRLSAQSAVLAIHALIVVAKLHTDSIKDNHFKVQHASQCFAGCQPDSQTPIDQDSDINLT